MKPPALDYARPETLADALARLDEPDAAPIAGGQSLVPMLSLRIAGARRLVEVARLAELAGVRAGAEAVVIGAATTHAMLEDGLAEDPSRGLLSHVASGIAYRSVRHFGTIGGALCLADPAADWPVCLVALGARLHIASRDGERAMAAADFVTGAYTTALGAAEILRAIEVPRLPEGAGWGWAKLARKQGAYADSLAAAVRRGPEEVPAIVLGATAAGPRMLPELAALLRAEPACGLPRLRAAIADAVAAADPAADPVRLRWHAAMVERAVLQMRAA